MYKNLVEFIENLNDTDLGILFGYFNVDDASNLIRSCRKSRMSTDDLEDIILNSRRLENRIRRLESLLLEAHKLDYITISNLKSADRTQHINAGLDELKKGDKLLMTGSRGSVAVVTKVADNSFEVIRGESSYNFNNSDIVDNVVRDGNNLHEMPKSIKLVPNSSIEYEDDKVVVYQGKKKVFAGIEDDEPMKRKDWKYIKSVGLYYLIDYADDKIYYKVKSK